MDPVSILARNWDTITAAPLAAFLLVAAGLAIGFTIARLIAKETVAAARERASGAMEALDRLKGEKGELLKRLETHGEDIAKIRAELAALPKQGMSAMAWSMFYG
jgi:mannitol-specific phosphotransferase system IIBC component